MAIEAVTSSRISASTAITITAVTLHCGAGRAPTENELINVAVIHTYFVNHV